MILVQSTGAAVGSESSSVQSSLVQIATVTQAPELSSVHMFVVPTATPGATSTEVPAETPTSEPVEARLAVVPTDTPPPPTDTPAEAPTVAATNTSTATPTVTATRSPTPSPTATPSPTPVTPTTVPLVGMSSAETEIFVAHNQIRDQHGLPRFHSDPTLMAIARQRAQTMASSGQFSHTNPDGTNVFDMMNARGYVYVTGAENIHYNYGYSDQESRQVAMQSWQNSPPHYASMVNPNLGRIGIGIATGANGHVYYSVVFSD